MDNTFNARPIVVSGSDAVNALEDRLGISESLVRAVISEAHQRAVAKANGYYPKTAAGLTRWIETVGLLREALSDHDSVLWKTQDENLRPTVKNTANGFEIGIVGGDSNTGLNQPDSFPKARRKKGSATQDSVNNQEALISVESLTPTVRVEQKNWFLLYFVSDDEIRCEISRPIDMQDGQFTGWEERFIIDPITPDNYTGPAEGGEDVDFQVG